MINSMVDLINYCKKYDSFSEAIIHYEMFNSGESYDFVWKTMASQLEVMRKSVQMGIEGAYSSTGLSGGDAEKMNTYLQSNKPLVGSLVAKASRNAIATNEVNASMGIICATPTAGSAGVLPGVLMALVEEYDLSIEEQIRFLFVAGGLGYVIANNASISGAEGGCQAEIGSASAMCAGAVVDYMGGSVEMAVEACSMTIKNMLGLICDPVAGLVEVPCVKRNALGASQALVSADLALAGIKSRIPADEVIATMYQVGLELPSKFRETGKGGLASTPTAMKLQSEIFKS